jgi:hypothetical protein
MFTDLVVLDQKMNERTRIIIANIRETVYALYRDSSVQPVSIASALVPDLSKYALASDALAGGQGPVPLYYHTGRGVFPTLGHPEHDYLGMRQYRHSVFDHFEDNYEEALFDPIRDTIEALQPIPDKHTVVYATVKYDDKDYVLRRAYPLGYSPGTARFDWEKNNCSCDHRRAEIFDGLYPGILTEKDRYLSSSCGVIIFPLIKFEIRFEN